METKILNYRIIIEPENYPDGSLVYNAYCPTLDVADYGDTVEEVLKSIKEGIELRIETLNDENKEIPADSPAGLVTQLNISLPKNFHFACS